MKKIFISLTIILGTGTLNKTMAQFDLGTNAVNVGIGLGSTFVNGYSSASPGLAISYEHGQWGNMGPGTISLGGYLGYKSFTYHLPDDASGRTSYTILGFRSAYHYTGFEDKRWDPYGGLMLSYSIASTNIDYYSYASENQVNLTLYLGGRYYLSDNWALNGEFGFGVSVLTLGASYRF